MNIKALYIAFLEDKINYFKTLDENNLKKEVFKDILENDNVFDLGLYWDALHFSLVGTSLTQPDFTNPLSELLSGTYPFFEDSEDYISYINNNDVKKLTEVLNKVNIYEKVLDITFKTLSENDIYPESFSEYSENQDMILREELRDNFNKLKIFFNKAKIENKGIVITLI